MNHLKEKLPREITISRGKILCRNIFSLHSEGRVKLYLGEVLERYCTFLLLLLLERKKGASKRTIKYISTVS